MKYVGRCVLAWQKFQNAHAKPQKLKPSRYKIHIINDCLLHGEMKNIKLKLAYKSVS
jgi:hypothetical protein